MAVSGSFKPLIYRSTWPAASLCLSAATLLGSSKYRNPIGQIPQKQLSTKSAPRRHQVEILLQRLFESEIRDLTAIAKRSERTKFRLQVLNPLLFADDLLVMTLPDKLTSLQQRCVSTDTGWVIIFESSRRLSQPVRSVVRFVDVQRQVKVSVWWCSADLAALDVRSTVLVRDVSCLLIR